MHHFSTHSDTTSELRQVVSGIVDGFTPFLLTVQAGARRQKVCIPNLREASPLPLGQFTTELKQIICLYELSLPR